MLCVETHLEPGQEQASATRKVILFLLCNSPAQVLAGASCMHDGRSARTVLLYTSVHSITDTEYDTLTLS